MSDPTYRYLDLAGGWPGSLGTGLVVEDDVLRLAPVVGDPVALADGSAGALAGAAGIGIGSDGTVYLADQRADRIVVVACDGSTGPFGCMGGTGAGIGQFDGPLAVLVGPRDALYVADTGNGRVQVIDRTTGVVTGVWTGFVAPVDLAADRSDRVYVADRDAPSIRRFDPDGREDAGFAAAIQASAAPPGAPRAVAVLRAAGADRLLVVDGATAAGPAALHVYTLDGAVDPDLDAAMGQIVADDIVQATADADTLYVAAPGGVLAFGLDGRLVGRVSDAPATASGLAIDCQGRLVVGGSGGVAVLGGVRRVGRGRLLVGPVPLVGEATRWDRVVAELDDPLPDGGHLRIWTRSSASATPPPLPPAGPEAAESAQPAARDTWFGAPRDAHDALVLNEPGPLLWICLDLAGDGSVSPSIRALRVDFLAEGLPGRLPAIYARDDVDRVTWRLVNLLAAPLDELGATIADLPRLFDPQAVPDRPAATWLDSLAVWVDRPLDRRWDETTRRDLVAGAFEDHGRRGTRANLESALARAAGAPVTISEPAAEATIWELGGEDTVLGLTTMLAAAEAQGAVVGTTAEVDRSHLIGDADVGWPLYADVAHRFCVRVAATDLAPERRAALEAAIDVEKPAHTQAHVCLVEAQTSVGFQARVGIDMIVGGPPPTLRLDDELDGRRVLKDQQRPSVGGRIGDGIRVGRSLTPLHGGR